MSHRGRRADGRPETPADTRFFDLREAGYRGPIDRDGYPLDSDDDADILRARHHTLNNPGPVAHPAKNTHRVGASNHHQNTGSGENPMVGNSDLGELAAVLGMWPTATVPQMLNRAGWLAREHDRWRHQVADLVAQLDQARAQLDQPCGSCHPCVNWADETWRRAGRSLPHVHEWDELQAEVEELRDARTVLASGVSLLADSLVELRSERAALWELLKTQTRRLIECREDYWELSAECSALDNEVAELRAGRMEGGAVR